MYSIGKLIDDKNETGAKLVNPVKLKIILDEFLKSLELPQDIYCIYQDGDHLYKHQNGRIGIPEDIQFKAAVYVFYIPAIEQRNENNKELADAIDALASRFLKIGVVGSKSDPRFNNQHYGFNANSTLALSLTGCKFDKILPIQKYCREHIGKYVWLQERKEKKKKSERIGESELEVKYKKWIKDNTQRLNIIFTDLDNTNRHLPELIEKYLHYRLRPVFEGSPENILEEQPNQE